MFKKFSQWWTWLLLGATTPRLTLAPRTVILAQQPYQLAMAQGEDVARLVEIERTIYHIPPWDETAFYYDLHRPNCLYLVLKNEQGVQAYAGMAVNFEAKDGHLTNVATHPAVQHQGLSTCLLRTLMQVALQHGLLTMSLEVRAENLTAQRLYHQLGFQKSGVKRHYYFEDGQDAYTMTLNLTQVKGI